jgi:hypothetical protein
LRSTQAAADFTDPFATVGGQGQPPRPTPTVASANPRRTFVRPPTASDDDASEQTDSAMTEDRHASAANATASSEGSSGTNAGDPSGAGPHSAMTAAPHSSLPPSAETATKGSDAVGQGPTAIGGQSSQLSDSGHQPASHNTGASAGAGPFNTTVPPWRSASWTRDADDALEQVRSRPEYDPYRELIRGYFDPSGSPAKSH